MALQAGHALAASSWCGSSSRRAAQQLLEALLAVTAPMLAQACQQKLVAVVKAARAVPLA